MQTVRLFFQKQDEAAYISHLDLQRVMARALRRSGLPVWYSQGFNPHIYMSFSLPLPLGQESVCESVDFKTESEQNNFSDYLPALNAALPKGIHATHIAPPKHKAAEISAAAYRILYNATFEQLQKTLQKYALLTEAPVIQQKKKTRQTLDLKQEITNLTLGEEGVLSAVFPAGSEKNLNPQLFVSFLEEQFYLPKNAAKIIRDEVLIHTGAAFC